MSADQVREAFDSPEIVQTEAPRPLVRETPPADPFPVDALGQILGAAAEAIIEKVQCPAAIAGQSVLAAATLAVQGHADIELPTGEQRPISNFFVSIAASGERKSTADQIALEPVRRREASLRQTYESDKLTYANQDDAWQSTRKRLLSKAKTREEREQSLEELGPPPVAPLEPLLTCPEPTFEGLCRLLQLGQPSVGVFSSEGGQFVGGFGMNEENRLKTAAALSGIWDGDPIRRVRAGDGVIILYGRRVSLHLMLQPGVAARLLGSGELVDQGLFSRFLVSAPDTTAGTRFWREPEASAGTALQDYQGRIRDILEAPLPFVPGKLNELQPRQLGLAPAALPMFVAFCDHIEKEIGPRGSLAAIRPLANKLAQHAVRLAAVLTLVADLKAGSIASEALDQGIMLVEHYAAEALRLTEAGAPDPGLRQAQDVLEWFQTSWPEPLVSLPDIYRLGPSRVRDAKTARAAVRVLEDHGWLVRIGTGAKIKGAFRREVWRLVPERTG